MGKCQVDDSDENCPICYSQIVEISHPKRCKHRYCYQCLTNWVKKGKKNCPLCRKTFSSVFKIHKKIIKKANGQVVEKQRRQQIKNEQIRAQGTQRISSVSQIQHYLHLNSLIFPASISFFVPSFPIFGQMMVPYVPSYFSSIQQAQRAQ